MSLAWSLLENLMLKAVPINALEHAFPSLFGSMDSLDSAVDAYSFVPWVFRAMTIRANAIAGVPWDLTYEGTEEEAENPFGNTDMRWLIWRISVARDLWGAAYIRASLRKRQLYWLNPSTMSYEYDTRLGKGITEFVQTVDGQDFRFKPTEIVYLPTWSPTNDLGPGVAPAEVALRSAGLDYNLTTYAEQFFAHGALPAVLLSSEQTIPEPEIEKVRDVWDRLYGGIKNMWRTAVLGRGLEPKVIGQTVKDLAMPEIDLRVLRQIAAAFEMTINFLTGENANYATAQMDTVNYFANTVTPMCRMVESGWNADLWSRLNLTFRFKTEAIEAMRQYEATKANAWSGLLEQVNSQYESGLLSIESARWLNNQLWDAMSFPVGDIGAAVEEEPEPLPEDVTDVPEDAEPVAEETGSEDALSKSAIDDLRRWRKKAIRRGSHVSFESDTIPDVIRSRIRRGLAVTKTADEIRFVFDSFINPTKVERFLPAGADDPVLDVPPYEVSISDEDVRRAIRKWDRLMPEFSGLLDARVDEEPEVVPQ